MEFLDCHHHFFDSKNNKFSKFLSSLIDGEAVYLPKDYNRDVLQAIEESESQSKQKKIRHVGSVHVEVMPDDGLSEVLWVESLNNTTVKAIVASCNLAEDNVEATLQSLTKASPKVRGIRWILDCVGSRKNPENEATHPGNLRHDGIDYLRDEVHSTKFAHGFSFLEKYGLSFDLQCAPEQLPAAAALCARYPNVPVVIDHLGKLMLILGKNNTNLMPDDVKLDEWRHGMKAMAKLPNVYVKISMLGRIIPSWIQSTRSIDLIRKLCQETVILFGPERCMIASNFHGDAASSDSDGYSTVGPTAVEYLEFMMDFFAAMALKEQ
eukprot:CAMPEP_0178896136 /NCGR_PEP_ID=MMETSP0786-20121207/989_1 /TAXON_ID=186022 /ORGANISM="Thalassionema frauenfeldii, Strain CCMP 1798" /LENGTH=322 /DNA_ID=CAMNT_0020566473 /DNA_START=82 /DNA_END=1047 /DNA_ORIENTATION=+